MSESGIFQEAVKLPPAERGSYLDRACAGNGEMRREIESLLRAHEAPGDFLATVGYEGISERPGTMVGPYKLMEQIGEGGMGLVFVAEQQQPVRRKVALKIVKPGMDTREVIARFEAERQALALMDHPNIAKVYDAGTTDTGRPFFVMELVKGIPIVEYCDQQQLSAKQRLDLFVSVCQAVQHAHAKGIIHRDLKPSNILVAPHDGVPVVKVIDFGVAKAIGQQLTDKTIYTRFTQMIGTPLYMSPEQAEINALDVDTRSDVYSLGVLLYELLTGATPFDRKRFATAAYEEIRRIIKEEEPPKPSTRLSTLGDSLAQISARRKTEPAKLSALVKGDLDWIVMKALEKDRNRRYETASALAADVRRFLSEEPIEARPPSLTYRFGKLARRNKAAIITVSLIAFALVAGTAVSTWQAIRASRAEAIARDNERVALANEQSAAKANDELRKVTDERRRTLYAPSMNLVQAAWESGHPNRAQQILREQIPKAHEDDLRGFEWHYWNRLVTGRGSRGVKSVPLEGFSRVAVAPVMNRQGTRVAEVDVDAGALKMWDAVTGRELWRAEVPHEGKKSLAWMQAGMSFSDDGKLLTSRWSSVEAPKGERRIWNVETGKLVNAFARDGYGILSPDGRYFDQTVTLSAKGYFQVCRVSDGQVVFREPPGDASKELYVMAQTFSPDSKHFAAVSRDSINVKGQHMLRIWSLDNGELKFEIEVPRGGIGGYALVYSADGGRIVIGKVTKTGKAFQILDTATGESLQDVEIPHPSLLSNPVLGGPARMSRSGAVLVSARGAIVQIVDLRIGDKVNAGALMPRIEFVAHAQDVKAIALSDDDRELITVSLDGTVRTWDITGRDEPRAQNFSDGSSLGHIVAHPGGECFAVMPPAKPEVDGKGKADKVSQGDIRILDAAGRLRSKLPVPPGKPLVASAFSRDGRVFASLWRDSAAGQNRLRVWDTDLGREIGAGNLPAEIHQLALSPDGERVIVRGAQTPNAPLLQTKVWQTRTGRELATLKFPGDVTLGMMSFSPDGRWIVGQIIRETGLPPGAAPERTLAWWNAHTGELGVSLPINELRTIAVFSRDGRRIAVWHGQRADSVIDIWDVDSILSAAPNAPAPKPLSRIADDLAVYSSLVFCPDGRRFLTSSGRDAKLWDPATGHELITLRAGFVSKVVFSADGQHVWAGIDAQGKLWGLDGRP